MPTVVAATEAGLLVGEETRFPGRDVRAVALDTAGEVWAVVDDELWHEAQRKAAVGPGATCLAVVDGSVLVGNRQAQMLRVESGGAVAVCEGFDALRERSGWYAVGSPVHVRSMARGHETVYVSVHVGGIVSGDAAGDDWHDTGFEVDNDVHQVSVRGGDELFAATALGLAHSADHGRTWAFEWEGLPACYARAVAVDASTGQVAISVSNGPGAAAGSVWMREDGGGFRSVGEPVGGNVDTGCLALAGGSVAYAHADRLWFDGTWMSLPGRVNAIALRP